MTCLPLTDALTGLSNRRSFQDALGHAFHESQRSGKVLSLLLVDIDHFKRVNDVHGHAVGDAVLKGISRRSEASADRPRALACRIWGEEFTLVLPNADPAEATRVAEAIHREVSRWPFGPAGKITVSVGVATSNPQSCSLAREKLYPVADRALYEAKAGGRDQTRFASIAPMVDRRGVPQAAASAR